MSMNIEWNDDGFACQKATATIESTSHSPRQFRDWNQRALCFRMASSRPRAEHGAIHCKHLPRFELVAHVPKAFVERVLDGLGS